MSLTINKNYQSKENEEPNKTHHATEIVDLCFNSVENKKKQEIGWTRDSF
jgi:hypothetical protein